MPHLNDLNRFMTVVLPTFLLPINVRESNSLSISLSHILILLTPQLLLCSILPPSLLLVSLFFVFFYQMEYKKYSEYALKVDEQQDDKAIEIKLCSLARPHMRAFHCSWWGFFVAFFIWFAISPLLSEIRDDLQLTHEEIWTSSIAGVAGTIFMRVILGPACDKWGARIPMAIVLCACSIPTACTGFVNSALGLSVLRLFIGCAGGCFVMCQYWTSRMFAKEVAGTANALVGGWGNLGGGVTQLVVGAG